MQINSSIKLLDSYEVAHILGISRSSVYRLTKEGSLGYIQVLRSRKLFTEELVREFIKTKSVRGEAARFATGNHLWAVE